MEEPPIFPRTGLERSALGCRLQTPKPLTAGQPHEYRPSGDTWTPRCIAGLSSLLWRSSVNVASPVSTITLESHQPTSRTGVVKVASTFDEASQTTTLVTRAERVSVFTIASISPSGDQHGCAMPGKLPCSTPVVSITSTTWANRSVTTSSCEVVAIVSKSTATRPMLGDGLTRTPGFIDCVQCFHPGMSTMVGLSDPSLRMWGDDAR